MTDAEILARLERRVADLEARTAVEQMHNRYLRAVADRRFDSLVDWFTEDAVIDMRFHGAKSGREAVAEHFSHMVNTPLTGASYFVTSPAIEIDGDSASGVWTWHRLHSTAQVAGALVTSWGVWEEGRYDCQYERAADGTWKFSSMKFRVVRPHHDDESGRTS